MFRIVAASPLGRFRVWLEYADGSSGEVDVSHLAGRGVFEEWEDANGFEQLSIGTGGELCWGDDVDLCPDALYMRLTGKTVEELFP